MVNLLFAAYLFFSSPPPKVSITAYTRVIMQGGQVRVTAKIERDPNNRHLWIEWFFEPGFENKKYYQIDGDQGPRVFQHLITLDEGGDWTVRAILIQKDESQTIATTTVRVIGRGMDDGQAF